VLLVELVDASGQVGATRSRKLKLAALAEVLSRAGADEVGPAAAFLAGRLRQGRIGVGWALVAAIDVEPASSPGLTVLDVDWAPPSWPGLPVPDQPPAAAPFSQSCSPGPPRAKRSSFAGCCWAISAKVPSKRW